MKQIVKSEGNERKTIFVENDESIIRIPTFNTNIAWIEQRRDNEDVSVHFKETLTLKDGAGTQFLEEWDKLNSF